MKKILFVCTGNICRSPTAEAVARYKSQELGVAEKFLFDSAGISPFHVGEAPDSRAVEVGEKNFISFNGISARQIEKKDFEEFDLILAMDRSHFSSLCYKSPEKHYHKIKLFLEFCETQNPWKDEVIDPYYSDGLQFEKVFEVIQKAAENLIKKLKDDI